MEKNKERRINTSDDAELLLMQLEELTDPKSVYFNQDVFNEKETIKEEILKGNITLESYK